MNFNFIPTLFGIENSISMLQSSSCLQMEEKYNPSLVDKANSYVYLKTQLFNFTQKEFASLSFLTKRTDQFIFRQRAKINIQPLEYSQQLNLIVAQLELYFMNLVTRITSLPLLANIAAILQQLMTEYNKILSFSQESCLDLLRQKKNSHRPHNSQLLTDVCMHCSQHIHHQQIKQARSEILNPIDDPYLFYQKGIKNKVEYVQEPPQKILQDKLNQLGNSVELGQSFIRQMINYLSLEWKNLNTTSKISDKDEEFNLTLIPLLRTVFKHIKGEIKVFQERGVQASFIQQSSNQLAPQQLNRRTGDKMNVKMASELIEKTTQLKILQQRLIESCKGLAELKIQVNILKDTNNNLQKRNSALEVQLNMSNSQLKVANSRHLIKSKGLNSKIEDMGIDVEHPRLETKTQHIQLQKKRISYRADVMHKKTQMIASGPPGSILNKPESMNQSRNSKNGRVFRKTDTTFIIKQESSTYSIDENNNNATCIDEIDQFSPPFPSAYQILKSKEATEQGDEVNNELSFKKSGLSKERILKSQKKLRDMIRSEHPSPQKDRRARRIGTFQNRQSILKLLYEEEDKEKENWTDFEAFKQSYNNFITKIVGTYNQAKQNNCIKQQKGPFSHTSKDKARVKHLKKKSAISIKHPLRNQAINRPQKFDAFKKHQLHYDDSSISQQGLKFEESQQFLQLKNSLLLNHSSDEKFDKKGVLEKKQHQMMTEIMAYLIQLKVNRKQNYEAIRKIISAFDKSQSASDSAQEKETLQLNLSNIISLHRACPHPKDSPYCSHLKILVNSAINLMA